MGPRNVIPILGQATSRVRQVSSRKKAGEATAGFPPRGSCSRWATNAATLVWVKREVG